MSNSPVHTRSSRAVEQLLRYTRLGRQLGLGRVLIEDDEFHGDTIVLRGHEVGNFGLCSYLGLGDDPRLIEAAVDAVNRYGNSYSSSTAYTALPLYGDLRERFEAMLDAPVVITASTTLAHMSALPVLVREGDTVAIDAHAHASLLGVIPSLSANGATVHRLPHSDLETLDRLAGDAAGRTWYLFDGLYSMQGVAAPAEDLRAMLDRHEDLWLYCDDAHSFGWSGRHGRGQFLERAGWHERIVMTYGLAKSFGTMGGIVANPDAELMELIETTGGPMIFGGPLPPGTLGASIASADIHLSDELPGLQEELMERIRLVNRLSEELELPLARREETPLWFCEIGPALSTISVGVSMLEKGYFLNVALFPAVPRNEGGVRFTVTRYNSPDQIEEMLSTLNEVRLAHEDGERLIDLTALENQPAIDSTER
ncbi:MAG TPA: aminotransferase class I/II-fold pyridoxal phosphate-dependent enzyme [Acidimicrobiia bacterium]|nr:aminotransferase class I/II-fold pyridoxal phosphate-dependent enzyme [Acidimicrobiia bacterium]